MPRADLDDEKRLTVRIIEYGPTAQIRVQGMLTERGPRLDIRTYFQPGDGDTDEWLPTKKGVRVDLEVAPTLLEHIGASLREIKTELEAGRTR